MKSIFINVNAQIIKGVCRGIQGIVVGVDEKSEIVEIQPEPNTIIRIHRDNIYQDKDGMILALGNDNDVFGTYHGGGI